MDLADQDKLVGKLYLDLTQLKKDVEAAGHLLSTIGSGLNKGFSKAVKGKMDDALKDVVSQTKSVQEHIAGIGTEAQSASNKLVNAFTAMDNAFKRQLALRKELHSLRILETKTTDTKEKSEVQYQISKLQEQVKTGRQMALIYKGNEVALQRSVQLQMKDIELSGKINKVSSQMKYNETLIVTQRLLDQISQRQKEVAAAQAAGKTNYVPGGVSANELAGTSVPYNQQSYMVAYREVIDALKQQLSTLNPLSKEYVTLSNHINRCEASYSKLRDSISSTGSQSALVTEKYKEQASILKEITRLNNSKLKSTDAQDTAEINRMISELESRRV